MLNQLALLVKLRRLPALATSVVSDRRASVQR
jgi:hypothetical protein